MDPGSYFSDSVDLFVDGDCVAAAFESDGATEACYAGANDEDVEWVGGLGKCEGVIAGVHFAGRGVRCRRFLVLRVEKFRR